MVKNGPTFDEETSGGETGHAILLLQVVDVFRLA